MEDKKNLRFVPAQKVLHLFMSSYTCNSVLLRAYSLPREKISSYSLRVKTPPLLNVSYVPLVSFLNSEVEERITFRQKRRKNLRASENKQRGSDARSYPFLEREGGCPAIPVGRETF
jgi:hypothetical protein